MRIYDDFLDYKHFCVCGDIHGEFKKLVHTIKLRDIRDTVVLIAGDCGVGFHKPSYYGQLYKKLSSVLEKNNCLLLLLRGNHDDPEYFSSERINYPQMQTIPDYSVIRFGNRNILCIGGACSIDRKYRLDEMRLAEKKGRPKPCYWENEILIFWTEEFDRLRKSGISIDSVITHTAPPFCHPVSKAGIENWLKEDDRLSTDLDKERETANRIYERLIHDGHPVNEWYYAHYHDSKTEFMSGARFQMLDVLEIMEIKCKPILDGDPYSIRHD